MELAYVNGVWGPIGEAKISIDDRGYQFGDGVYEVVAAYQGRPCLLDRHMARFRRSAAAIHLGYDFDAQPIEPLILDGLRRSGIADAMVYIQMTRGVAPRSHVIPPNMKPTVVLTVRPLPRVPDEDRRRGARLMTARDTRWDHCYIKAITLLPNILARNEAIRHGYDDALFVTADGEIMECTSSNVFLLHGKKLCLPARTEAILHGVTQAFLIECAESIGLAVEERRCDLNLLASADEAMMSSTTIEVLGVTSVDGKPVGRGVVGPVTEALLKAYRSLVLQHLSMPEPVKRAATVHA